jgi:hypothetical protein
MKNIRFGTGGSRAGGNGYSLKLSKISSTFNKRFEFQLKREPRNIIQTAKGMK